jgi:hypothetical protein
VPPYCRANGRGEAKEPIWRQRFRQQALQWLFRD